MIAPFLCEKRNNRPRLLFREIYGNYNHQNGKKPGKRMWSKKSKSKVVFRQKPYQNYVLYVLAKKRKLSREYAIYKVYNKYWANSMIFVFCLGGCERHVTGVATSLLGVYLKWLLTYPSMERILMWEKLNRSGGVNEVYYGGFKTHKEDVCWWAINKREAYTHASHC